LIESEGWKEEIQKHVFIVNLENRRDMEEEEVGLPPVLIELEFYVYSTIESRWINKQ